MVKKEKTTAVIIRKVPAAYRRRLKSLAALEGKSMQQVILELITNYIGKAK